MVDTNRLLAWQSNVEDWTSLKKQLQKAIMFMQPCHIAGTINVTSTYDSRIHGLESSLVVRGDLWRVEASQAVWSKQRRWLVMSMICLNPLACSPMDLQFPNGQFTYVSGEGISTSAFLPFCGGLLQAQGRYPGDMTFSYSRKDAEGVLVANIGSYMGGVDLWQNEDETYDNFDPQSMHEHSRNMASRKASDLIRV